MLANDRYIYDCCDIHTEDEMRNFPKAKPVMCGHCDTFHAAIDNALPISLMILAICILWAAL